MQYYARRQPCYSMAARRGVRGDDRAVGPPAKTLPRNFCISSFFHLLNFLSKIYSMSQTDRQTDKAIHWNSAIFDVGENWAILKAPPPSFIKEIHMQQEECPTTKRLHYQTHVVCYRQVRLTQLTGWIKQTNWKPVRGKEYIANSIAYTAKKETAVAGTHTTVQGERYYQLHEILQTMARYSSPEWKISDCLDVRPDESPNSWKAITRRLIDTDITWVNRLSNPTLRRMWNDWGSLFIKNWEDGGSLIIEEPPVEGEPEVNAECLIE